MAKFIRKFSKNFTPPPRHVYWTFSACVNEGREEGPACADPWVRTPIGASGNFLFSLIHRKIYVRGFMQKIIDLALKMKNWWLIRFHVLLLSFGRIWFCDAHASLIYVPVPASCLPAYLVTCLPAPVSLCKDNINAHPLWPMSYWLFKRKENFGDPTFSEDRQN